MQVTRRVSSLTHSSSGFLLVSMEMPTSRLLLLGPMNQQQKRSASMCFTVPASSCLRNVLLSQSESSTQRHYSALCVRAPTRTHSAEEEEKEEEEEVPEGGEFVVFVWFSLKIFLQYRLFFHWLLCGPAGFCVVRIRAWLLNVNAKGGHGADRFCLVLLRLALNPQGAIQ